MTCAISMRSHSRRARRGIATPRVRSSGSLSSGMAASFWCLAQALRSIPLGTGYAVWVGIGAVGTALLGMWLHGEPASWPRLACIGLIVAGIAGLKLTG